MSDNTNVGMITGARNWCTVLWDANVKSLPKQGYEWLKETRAVTAALKALESATNAALQNSKVKTAAGWVSVPFGVGARVTGAVSGGLQKTEEFFKQVAKPPEHKD